MVQDRRRAEEKGLDSVKEEAPAPKKEPAAKGGFSFGKKDTPKKVKKQIQIEDEAPSKPARHQRQEIAWSWKSAVAQEREDMQEE